MPTAPTAEHERLAEATGRAEDDLFDANPWYEWGPYLSERAWGTVREDYTPTATPGTRSRTTTPARARTAGTRTAWPGISDIHHELCLALALWNGRDPILKERMFGLTGPQGNHGEDVKEYWWYLDGLPSHALLQWRYHYPQAAFPYDQLVDHGRGLRRPRVRAARHRRVRRRPLLVVDVTYAKASPDRRPGADHRREPRARTRRRSTCCRRCGSATPGAGTTTRRAPAIELDGAALAVDRARLAGYRLEAAPGPDGALPDGAVLRQRDERAARLRRASAPTPYPKDGINDHVVAGAATVNPDGPGTKAALWYHVTVAAGARPSCACGCTGRGGHRPRAGRPTPFDDVVGRARGRGRRVLRRARAGRHRRRAACGSSARPAPGWSGASRCTPTRRPLARRRPRAAAAARVPPHGRNAGWRHLDAFDVLAMPDPWEYPWFAAWDLGVPRDPVGAPRSGVREVPAARAAARVVPAPERRAARVRVELRRREPAGARDGRDAGVHDRRRQDREFLERVFQKLLVNFTWWVNRRGPRRQQPVRRRLPRPRQHQPDRPLEPAARHASSSRPTARRGWRTTRSAMLMIAVVLAEENRRLRRHGREVPRAVRR